MQTKEIQEGGGNYDAYENADIHDYDTNTQQIDTVNILI